MVLSGRRLGFPPRYATVSIASWNGSLPVPGRQGARDSRGRPFVTCKALSRASLSYSAPPAPASQICISAALRPPSNGAHFDHSEIKTWIRTRTVDTLARDDVAPQTSPSKGKASTRAAKAPEAPPDSGLGKQQMDDHE
jgi:hypothetical protein